ncbi:MAG: ABC transporter substrate-binding protein [Spirochaetaceae bacterium]|nr:MAG: ABC transporter substrate-binding protein [Spirochaetaceae bacterium]
MKRVRFIALVAVGMLVAVAAFGTGAAERPDVIGISKIVAHPALDAVEQGIMDELADLGYELEYDLQNAAGDVSTAASIATKFRSDRVRLAVGIATPTSQALVNALSDIPVVYAAVTDPVDAGLVDSYERGGPNVTGVSDMTPVRAQIEMLARLTDLRRLGHVYASGEANAVRLADMAREAANELGIEFVEATVTNSAEVRQATQSIIGRVDGIYVSTDNTVVSALSSLVDVAMTAGIPVLTADPSSAEEFDVLAAWGFDYYQMGRVAGRLIARILEGTPTSEIGTVFMTDPSDIDLLINLDVAQRLGISFPDDILQTASKIVENGVIRTQ